MPWYAHSVPAAREKASGMPAIMAGRQIARAFSARKR